MDQAALTALLGEVSSFVWGTPLLVLLLGTGLYLTFAMRFMPVRRIGTAFRLLFRPEDGYGWGSNQSVIQNMIVVATAYDITGQRRYLQAVRESMDYILGRNALGISYVTGYGTTYAHRQFSFMFANATDTFYPPPPKGALAGGPNSSPADDYAIKQLAGCAPQACYVDDSRSFSTNEIAINWNAPLTWIASFLADAR